MQEVDRRKLKRIDSKNLLNYRVLNKEEQVNYREGVGITKQVSEGGFLFETAENFLIGTLLEFELALKDEFITVIGEVVYAIPKNNDVFDLGVRFCNISESNKNVLRKIIDKAK
jgi:c-di-GMP-binding flagellar brake protein YcgR